jgi:hypothetical protein
MSCPFKDIFGKPGTGPHSYRIFDIAVVDTALTVLGAFLISKYIFKKTPFLITLLFFFLLGEILHWIFCVDTAFILKVKSLIK